MGQIQTKRIDWIDIAKSIGILIVLTFHACPESYFKNFLWQMHMPLFAFLSGIVYSEKYSFNLRALKIFARKKIKTIYMPFVSYSLIFLVFHNMFYRIHFIGSINGNEILSGGGYVKKLILILTLGGGESLTGPLWYLIPLLELEIIFAMMVFFNIHIKKGAYSDGITIFVCVILYTALANANLPRNLSNAFRLLLFYCGGFYCKKYNLLKMDLRKYQRIGVFTCCMFMWLGCTYYSTSWQDVNLLIAALSAGTGIYCVVDISKFIVESKLKKTVEVLKYIGKKTMSIVALHLLMYCFVKVAYVLVHHMDYELIATKEAIVDWKWIGIYVLSGLLGSLAIEFIVENVKESILKIGGKTVHGGIE